MLRNSKTSLIVIGKKDACVKIMESSCLRYGTMKTQKLLSPKEYKKLRVSLIKHPEFSTYSQFIMYNLISNCLICISYNAYAFFYSYCEGIKVNHHVFIMLSEFNM